MRLPPTWTAIATRTDQGHDWTPLPRALVSVEAAHELRMMGHAEVKESPGGMRLMVLQVRAKRS
jgi:hypothetical protein